MVVRYLLAGLLGLTLLGGCPQTAATGNGGSDTPDTGADASGGDNTAGGANDAGSGGAGDSTGDVGGSTGDANGSDDDDDGAMSAAERQLALDALAAMNDHRAGRGLAPLTWFEAGAAVAFEHSLAMDDGGFFAHNDPVTGKDPATRASDAGIVHDPDGFVSPDSGNPFVGENIYRASGTTPAGDGPVDAWIGSPGHHAQIVAPQAVTGAQTMPAWTHCGIGVHVESNQHTWTAMFFKDPQ